MCLSGSTLYFVWQTVSTVAKVVRALRDRRTPLLGPRPGGLRAAVGAMQKERMDLSFYSHRVRELLVGVRRRKCHLSTSSLEPRSRLAWLWQLGGCLRSRLYRNVKYFRYSPRIVAMATVSAFLLFEVTVLWCLSCKEFSEFVYRVLDGLHCHPVGVMMSVTELPSNSWSQTLQPYFQMLPGVRLSVDMGLGLTCHTIAIIRDVVYYCFLASGIISAVMHLGFLLHMVACYRKHIRRMARGDRSMIPKLHSQYPAFAIVDGLKYAGFQVAYVLVGWLFIALVWCLICLFIAFTIVLPIMKIYGDVFWKSIFLPRMWPFVISIGLYYFQAGIVRLFFQASGANGFNIRNSRLFHNVDFFFFFINVFIGLYSFVVRLGANIFYGLLFLCRLDKNMLSRGYEMQDPGFRTYVGFLLLDYYYSNPTAITFAEMLVEDLRDEQRREREQFPHLGEPGTDDDQGETALLLLAADELGASALDVARYRAQRIRSARVRSRWGLYVTLVNNPRLRDLRKQCDRRRRNSFRTHEAQTLRLERKYGVAEAATPASLSGAALPPPPPDDGNVCHSCGRPSSAAPPSRSASLASFDYYAGVCNAFELQQYRSPRGSRVSLHVGSPTEPDAKLAAVPKRRGHRRHVSAEPSLLAMLEAEERSSAEPDEPSTPAQPHADPREEPPEPQEPEPQPVAAPAATSVTRPTRLPPRLPSAGHVRLPSLDLKKDGLAMSPPVHIPAPQDHRGHARLPSLDLRPDPGHCRLPSLDLRDLRDSAAGTPSNDAHA